MDLSDILFYIVIGAIGIFSYVSQRKAKKQAEEIERRKRQQPAQRCAGEFDIYPKYRKIDGEEYAEKNTDLRPMDGTQQEPMLDDIFRALRERRPISPVQKQKVKQPAPFLMQEEGKRAISEDLTKQSITDENIYNAEHSESENASGIDWRQAIISAEILNRKY